ncbi:hypothetical protein EVAR_31580_1 [Eumeta japonica]|uniref:Uncharacterized protein n=1 Tax=Eumeta variegata TaxID=151549 RepID=A0A4C1V830_EUMVA|nr:hypothetical protein EVAR_31580_1 [Eumeta japonica]
MSLKEHKTRHRRPKNALKATEREPFNGLSGSLNQSARRLPPRAAARLQVSVYISVDRKHGRETHADGPSAPCVPFITTIHFTGPVRHGRRKQMTENRSGGDYEDKGETIINRRNKYQLKTELIKRLTSSERQVKQLLNHESWVTENHAVLRHLKHLAGPGVPDDFIRTVWTSRLTVYRHHRFPKQIDIGGVSELADQIMDVATQPTNYSSFPVIRATSRSNHCSTHQASPSP